VINSYLLKDPPPQKTSNSAPIVKRHSFIVRAIARLGVCQGTRFTLFTSTKVLNLLASLVQGFIVRKGGMLWHKEALRGLGYAPQKVLQFTCFTSTKVQASKRSRLNMACGYLAKGAFRPFIKESQFFITTTLLQPCFRILQTPLSYSTVCSGCSRFLLAMRRSNSVERLSLPRLDQTQNVCLR
jgi:hypothetical protein